MIAAALTFLLAINLATVIALKRDKQRAITGAKRIAEADLLGLALIGGSPGALLARQIFRHKTRKQPFSTWLWLILAAQVGAVAGLAWS